MTAVSRLILNYFLRLLLINYVDEITVSIFLISHELGKVLRIICPATVYVENINMRMNTSCRNGVQKIFRQLRLLAGCPTPNSDFESKNIKINFVNY